MTAVRLPFMTTTDPAPVPNPHATAEQVEAARHDTKLAQVLYHDWEAESYDDKWSISYDQRCIDYARGRFVTAQEALALGMVEEVVATDEVNSAAQRWAGQFVYGPVLDYAA